MRILLIFGLLALGSILRDVARSAPLNHDPLLQSAYLHRDDPSRFTAKHSLESHFDRVLEILRQDEPASLERALDRLEQSQGVQWTKAERANQLEVLAARRSKNVETLKQYRERGRFPLNQYDYKRPVPVFIDDHDTACAVGYLMRQSGAATEAESIASANRFVYVDEVKDGPLIHWILTSGLTQEEAALIQPQYGPQPEALDIAPMLGGELTSSDLIFSNLKVSTTPDPESESTVLFEAIEALRITTDHNRILPWESHLSNFDGFTHSAGLGRLLWTDINHSTHWVESTESGDEGHLLVYEFEVSPAQYRPKDINLIDQFAIACKDREFNVLSSGAKKGRILIESVFFDSNGKHIGKLAIDSNAPGSTLTWHSFGDIVDGRASMAIKPTQSLRVVTSVRLWGDARFNLVSFAFNRITRAKSFPANVEFTSPKSGVISVPSQLGYAYVLMRSTSPGKGGERILKKWGTGGELTFPFDDSNSTDRSAYFWVDRVFE